MTRHVRRRLLPSSGVGRWGRRQLLMLAAVVLAGGCTHDPTTEPTPTPEPPAGAPLTQTAATECGACHAQHYQEWQRSMHAYAGQDPVWFALARRAHEVTNGEIGDFCMVCHVPAAVLAGPIEQPLFEETAPPSITRGVHCGFCHTVDRYTGISSQDAEFEMATDAVVYGTIPDPVPNAFHRSELRSSLHNSAFCGTCHELANDLDTVLERTYSEWLGSAYTAMGIDCNDCHMPTYRGRATPEAPERLLHRHTFAGVDVELEDTPARQQQIAEAEALLANIATLTLSGSVLANVATIDATVENRGAGHALPSGATMDRQLWIELVVEDAQGARRLTSGDLDANGDLRDQHSVLDPVGDPQLAVFRTVMYDENGEETPFMWRARSEESNLIPPFGSRTARYELQLPADASGPLMARARLRLRALPPYLLRAVGRPDLVELLPIFELASAEIVIPTAP